MKQYIIALISLILMQTICYSQETSKSTSPIKTDTAFSVSNDNISTVNHMMVDLDACNELADSLNSTIKNYKILSEKDLKITSQQAKDIQLLEKQVSDLTELKELYKSGEKKEKTKNRFTKALASGFGIVAAAEAVWIGIKSLTE